MRYTARNRAIGDMAREADLNGLFLAIYTVIGVLTAGVGLLLYFNLDVVMDNVYWGTGQFILGIVSGTIAVALSTALALFISTGPIMNSYYARLGLK